MLVKYEKFKYLIVKLSGLFEINSISIPDMENYRYATLKSTKKIDAPFVLYDAGFEKLYEKWPKKDIKEAIDQIFGEEDAKRISWVMVYGVTVLLNEEEEANYRLLVTSFAKTPVKVDGSGIEKVS